MSNNNQYEIQRKKLLEEKWYDKEMLAAFRMSIQKGVSPEEATILGKKLLELIFKKGYTDLDKNGKIAEATELIFAGANLEEKSMNCGNTSLLVCAKKGLYATFSLLVRAGADINAQNNFLSTAAMWSARRGHLEILKDLLLLQADINLKCQDGDTALHSAVRHNQIESVNLLVQAGVILNSPNNLGVDVLNLAWSKGYTEVAQVISKSLCEQQDQTQFPQCTEEQVFEELRLAREKLKTLR